MPSWSIRYQGALDDQQINDIVHYLVDMSSENVPFEDNVCLNPDAVGRRRPRRTWHRERRRRPEPESEPWMATAMQLPRIRTSSAARC